MFWTWQFLSRCANAQCKYDDKILSQTKLNAISLYVIFFGRDVRLSPTEVLDMSTKMLIYFLFDMKILLAIWFHWWHIHTQRNQITEITWSSSKWNLLYLQYSYLLTPYRRRLSRNQGIKIYTLNRKKATTKIISR